MPEEAIQPGATAFTRTPAYCHSTAAVSVRLSMPARAAPEWPMPGMEHHMSAMMFTTEPPLCSIHWVKHSRAMRKPPVRLLRTTVSKPFCEICLSGA